VAHAQGVGIDLATEVTTAKTAALCVFFTSTSFLVFKGQGIHFNSASMVYMETECESIPRRAIALVAPIERKQPVLENASNG